MEYQKERSIPVLPIRNSVVFPSTAIPLKIGRAKSIAAVQAAQENENWIVAISQKIRSEKPDIQSDDLYQVGTLCKIEKVRGNASDGLQILVRGVYRFKVLTWISDNKFISVQGEELKDTLDADNKTLDALVHGLKEMAIGILELLPADTEQLRLLIKDMEDPFLLSHLCSSSIDLPLDKKQDLLEIVSLKSRCLVLLELLQKQKDSLQIQNEIQNRLSHKVGKNQRESILREQLKTIQEELGEKNSSSDVESFRKRIEEAAMPKQTLKVALQELQRLEKIGDASPESHIVRNYLDLLCSLPWSKSASQTVDDIELKKAQESLDSDHFGLQKIKDRILQHLAIMKLKKSTRGSILLFVGPPGVGKTSLGQSIAKVLDRKFVRASLGGVRDDAEIRGHRRTYIGALPGRIIQGMKQAGENNPVFMLDEIDKLTRGYQGDPAAALLEVLDPEQNSTFLDHYLDVPFDLSQTFFIATANSLESIPGPLLDRMEVIELTGYTTIEKLHIAKNHLIPKQFSEFGITSEQLIFDDEALLKIITHYTREAGVRDLKRKIASACRATSRQILDPTRSGPVHITVDLLESIFGPEKYIHEVTEKTNSPGVVTGLAWTPQGGEILLIESSLMPGTGKLILTGQLGEVMRESAQIAFSVMKAKLGYSSETKDVHIHVPAGAIPKDGPSAGTALLATLASLFSGISVHPKIALTGELTLRGAVMPVGGIKEKVLGAHRAGVEKIIMSKKNQNDIKEVPEEIRSELKFEFVETASEILKSILGLDFNLNTTSSVGEASSTHSSPAHTPLSQIPPTPAVA
jgi:ATP-dependent Lon protease